VLDLLSQGLVEIPPQGMGHPTIMSLRGQETGCRGLLALGRAPDPPGRSPADDLSISIKIYLNRVCGALIVSSALTTPSL